MLTKRENNKEKIRSEIANIFMKISCENTESNELAEIARQAIQKENKKEFNTSLELITMWFQSILGLKISPSAGRSDNRKMATTSLKQLIKKVNDFHDFISANELYLGFLPKIKQQYIQLIKSCPEAEKILNEFQNKGHKNLQKLNLIESDFKMFLYHLGIFPKDNNMKNEECQEKLKIIDSLIKMIVLLHKPIGNVNSRFQ